MMLIVVALLLNACSDTLNNEFETEQVTDEFISTRSGETTQSNHVTRSDIAKLIGLSNPKGKQGSKSATKISCITDSHSDTLLYAVDKAGGGWCVYSSDKRVPHVVAYSETGSFSKLMEIEAAKVWLQTVACDMKIVRNMSEDKLAFTEKEIEENQKFWKSISEPEIYSIEKKNGNRIIRFDTTKLTRLFIPRGHYEYRGSTSYREDYDEIPRLTKTDWHQLFPFNNYCPYKATDIGRAPAGCVAISAAQMLFFLHHKFGVPRTAPSTAYCNGRTDSKDYDWAQTNYTAEIWDDMKSKDRSAAPLIADIGRRVGMKYGDQQSSAATKNLVDKVFKPYGVTATYGPYDVDIVKRNLTNGLPVIVCAASNLAEQTKLAGHSFIIDRYKRTREIVVGRYEWVYDYIPENTFIECVQDSLTRTYRQPEITMVGMNWGERQENIKNNDGWFSLTGDWYVTDGKTDFHWNIQREMLYINSINL